jgi:3-oxoadipate enol-lactonase
MLTQVARVGGRSCRYLEAGAGPPVIWLHAFPLSADQWLPQLAAAPEGRRIIAPDHRGFRGVEAAAIAPDDLAGVTIDDYAADVLALMTHLGLEKAAIGGVSMGGYVALAIVARAPERVSSLVLVNTRATPDSADGRAARDRMIDLVHREGPAGVAREIVPKLLGDTERRERPDQVAAVARLIEANSAEALEAALVAMKMRPDRTPLLPAIRCPTLVVIGAEDSLIPAAEGEAMGHAIRGATIAVVPGAGHLLWGRTPFPQF